MFIYLFVIYVIFEFKCLLFTIGLVQHTHTEPQTFHMPYSFRNKPSPHRCNRTNGKICTELNRVCITVYPTL